ncbi:MAG: RecX family transcriptional regulator [Bacteroidales bacterium]|nr:RecX family transcriptional regulator [Bacteroidales bacterium]MCF8458633.1 RecX family transcriptional regulator [Bacteroidales bacterium]
MKKQTSVSEVKALDKLMELCSQQEKCKADLRQKLFRWDITGEEAEKILGQLEADNFINEERFARAFAKDKIRFNKWGKNKVRYQLKMKEIPENLIGKALSEFDEEEYRVMIRKEIIEKNRKTKAVSDWERKGKIMQFAQSRGYEADVVMGILDKLAD